MSFATPASRYRFASASAWSLSLYCVRIRQRDDALLTVTGYRCVDIGFHESHPLRRFDFTVGPHFDSSRMMLV